MPSNLVSHYQRGSLKGEIRRAKQRRSFRPRRRLLYSIPRSTIGETMTNDVPDYATEVQLDKTIFFIGTFFGKFVTGKKKTNGTTLTEETTLETINTGLSRAKEKASFAVGE
ncbi:hypothetical protein L5515_000300 [Caenorhabditis briggsae]|uniref:Uncharacterized protein n=1 Tax=Caenorhabditis briggsae TaxID=6238 RepID=A0AAE9DXZ9_CAEBR|nr:hypothetical protein L5515_000300 [Caenorhabditis briggsae]